MAKSFGEILREARLAKGLSTSQVAARTNILVKTIEALEEEDFRKIPAPIYGRGFVRLYCDCVELDSAPLIAEYMQIVSGSKTPLYLRREKQTADTPFSQETPVFSTAPETAPVREPAAEEPVQDSAEETFPQSVSGLELFERPEKVNPFGESGNASPFSDPYDSPFVTHTPRGATPLPSRPNVAERFKSGISVFSNEIVKTVHGIPRRTWRMVVLGSSIALIIFFVGWIVSKLYQMTSVPAGNAPAQISSSQSSAAGKTTAEKDFESNVPSKPRGKLKSSGFSVPPLYVD
jgi:transcriptional regulator with XRE-family HTH domain